MAFSKKKAGAAIARDLVQQKEDASAKHAAEKKKVVGIKGQIQKRGRAEKEAVATAAAVAIAPEKEQAEHVRSRANYS